MNAQVKTNAIADAIVAFNSNVKSASNAKKRSDVASLARDSKVSALMKAQNIKADDMNIALYATEKVVKFFHAITREVLDVDALEINMTCVVKTLLNAQDADVALTRADVYASIMIDAKASDTRAHVYQRKTRIASEAQVNYCLLALKQAKLIDVTTHKARDCEALRIARDKLKDVAL